MGESPRASRVVALNSFWIALNISNNALDPVVLPTLVEGVVAPDIKNTALAVLGAAGLVIAMLWQPVVGAMSDRARGGRLPFLLVGALAFILGLPLLALAPSFATLLLAIVFLQLASNTIQGPLQALIPDYLAPAAYGAASGLKTLFEVAGTVLGGFVGGQLVSAGHLPWVFVFVAAVLTAAAVVTTLALRGRARRAGVALADPTDYVSLAASLRSLTTPPLRPFLWWLINRYLAAVAFTSIRAFAFFFVQDYLGLPNPAAVVGNLIAAIGLVVGVAALPLGMLGHHRRRRPLLVAAMLLGAIATPLFLVARAPLQLWAVGALIGLSVATYQVVGWAMAMDLAPAGQVGRYLGLSNIATAGGSFSARLGGILIDALNRSHMGLGYAALFGVNSLLFLLAALAIRRVPHLAMPGDKAGPAHE